MFTEENSFWNRRHYFQDLMMNKYGDLGSFVLKRVR